jgi:hypothetical protein
MSGSDVSAQQMQNGSRRRDHMAGYDDRDGKIWMDGKLVALARRRMSIF